jgi:hypothetical protein
LKEMNEYITKAIDWSKPDTDTPWSEGKLN